MIFKLSSGRSASSARISLKLNTEAFEKTAVAGTDAKSRSQWPSKNANLLDEEFIPSIRAQQLQPKRGELVAVLWPGSAFAEVSWLRWSVGLETRIFMSHWETQLFYLQHKCWFPSPAPSSRPDMHHTCWGFEADEALRDAGFGKR